MTLFLTGMRYGEASALRWEDIDERLKVIHLRRSHVDGHVSTPKTGKTCIVPLHELVSEGLDMQREWLLKLQRRKGQQSGYVRGFTDGWVFPTRVGGLSQPSTLRKPFRKVSEEMGLPRAITSHDARRTFNTPACQAGVSHHVIQAIMGHSSDQMTAHYRNVEVRERLRRHQGLAKVIAFADLSSPVGGSVGGSDSKRNDAPSLAV